MKSAILVSILLAGASASLAQSLLHRTTSLESCLLGQAAAVANATANCTPPPPPPPGGKWSNFVQRAWTDNQDQALAFPNPPPQAGACSGFTCDVWFSQPLTPGSSLYIQGFFLSGNTMQITSCNGVAFAKAPVGQLSSQFGMQIDSNYVLRNTSSASHLVCNFSGVSTGWQAIMIAEALPNTGTVVSFDTAAASIGSCGVSYPGIGLSITGQSDWIMQTTIPFSTDSNAVSSPYTKSGGGDYAYWMNATNGNAPTWTLPPPSTWTPPYGVNGNGVDTCANVAIAFAGN